MANPIKAVAKEIAVKQVIELIKSIVVSHSAGAIAGKTANDPALTKELRAFEQRLGDFGGREPHGLGTLQLALATLHRFGRYDAAAATQLAEMTRLLALIDAESEKLWRSVHWQTSPDKVIRRTVMKPVQQALDDYVYNPIYARLPFGGFLKGITKPDLTKSMTESMGADPWADAQGWIAQCPKELWGGSVKKINDRIDAAMAGK